MGRKSWPEWSPSVTQREVRCEMGTIAFLVYLLFFTVRLRVVVDELDPIVRDVRRDSYYFFKRLG